MPTLEQNAVHWREYAWPSRGDEWSAPWGGASAQWYATILPRIRSLLPVRTALEIACGQGRWTAYLKDLCEHLIAVDLSEGCVRVCQERFASASHIEYHVNDGRSLSMIADESVDFVFSFDSLVHSDQSTISSYLTEVSRVLSPEGTAFLHHSNLGEYAEAEAFLDGHPRLRDLLGRVGLIDPYVHWRDPGVSARFVCERARVSGLSVVAQEVIHWRTRRFMIDCLTTLARQRSARGRQRSLVFRNIDFMREARHASLIAHVYGRARS